MALETSVHPIWEKVWLLPSVSGSGEDAVETICSELESRNWSDADVFALRLALSEALQNAVEHGNHRAADKSVHLTGKIFDDYVLIEVGDEGAGFKTEDAPDPTLEENIGKISGRGLFLIRNFMTNVWHNEAGNIIYMKKKHSEETSE